MQILWGWTMIHHYTDAERAAMCDQCDGRGWYRRYWGEGPVETGRCVHQGVPYTAAPLEYLDFLAQRIERERQNIERLLRR